MSSASETGQHGISPAGHGIGIAMIVLSALCWSTAGFFARIISLDAWTILFWRAVFGAVLTGACALWLGRPTPGVMVRYCQPAYWWIVFWMTAGTIAFIPALKMTSVAEVVVVYATTPLIAAFLAWLWLDERIPIPTLGACVLALIGVAIMVDGGFALGGYGGGHWGIVLAFAMAVSMAMMTVAFRRHRRVDCWSVGCLSNLLTASIVFALARPLSVGPLELAYLVLFALVQMTLGLGLFVMGTRMLPAAQATLIGVLETPLAPFWVWLAFDEVPSKSTVLGGTVIMAAVVGHILVEHRRALWTAPDATPGSGGKHGS